MDFVLWKPSDADLPGWESPWGRGRPGWHIECSAMSYELLGASFDIHGGGLDLQFPHHENEIAQSCCAHPEAGFANVWMHNEMLQVEGKKMSKSLGNFFTVRDLLDQGVPGEVIRFVYLSTHYSKPMDWTKEKAEQARRTLVDWYSKTDGVEPDYSLIDYVKIALSDDLNTHAALQELRTWSDSGSEHSAGCLKAGMLFLGFPAAEQVNWFRKSQSTIDGISYSGVLEPKIDTLDILMKRWAAMRSAGRYVEADTLKAGIESAGVKVSVIAGKRFAEVLYDFDPAKLESLL